MDFESIEQVIEQLSSRSYLLDRSLATTVYLSVQLNKPMFLEGEPGVGKTELAKVLAGALDAQLVRLQCYEGLDAATALYEWNYPRQMLHIRLEEARGVERQHIGDDIFSPEFLLQRPLLQALQVEPPGRAVLLIDEIDRADEEFEAFLLEILADFQVTIPELGTLQAVQPPVVVLTSNRTREIHDALKRRCLYHWIDYPDLDKEVGIVRARVPGIGEELAAQVCRFMHWVREQDLYKHPGVAETVDWARALLALGIAELDRETTETTLGCILKYKGDLDSLNSLDLIAAVERARTGGVLRAGIG
jgi:MoxR-like ATPase